MKERILAALKESDREFISGERLSEKLGVSRTTVWKNINALKEEGYIIESYSKKGYRLNESPDKLSKMEIDPFLKTKNIGREYIYLEEVDSTNEEVKRLQREFDEGLVVVAEKQNLGKGRLGREWQSPDKKGIYMSILLKPDIAPQDAPKMTQIAAAAVAEGLNNLDIDCQIKWPNDIVIDGKKVCGILTEMSGELMSIEYIVVGIGINTGFAESDLDEELRVKATSVNMLSCAEIDRKEILASVLNSFEELYDDFIITGNIEKSIDICRVRSAVIGRDIRILRKDYENIRKAIDIDSEGALVVEDSYGNRERIVSGEISIRGLNSYI